MAKPTVEAVAEVSLDLTQKGLIQVLHVDDETAFLKGAKQILEMQGAHEVETASSVEEAMKKMKKKTFDVIVADYVMPGKDGLEFLKDLRDSGNNIPFIIFTGKGREEVAIKALNLGADRYFNKIGHPEAVYGELAHGIRRAVGERRAQMEIWRREERLRAILTSSPDAIIISDLNANVIDCNQATLRLTGYPSKEDIIGKNSLEFIAEKDRDRALENLKKTLEQGATRNLEYTLLKKDGEEYIGELSASVINDSHSNFIGFVGVVRDITERKKAEEELKQSEEKWRCLAENMPSFVSIIDKDCRILSINRTIKLSKKEIIGSNVCNYIDPKYRPLLKKKIREVFNSGKATGVRTENVYGLWYENYIGPIFHNGNVANAIMVSQDITEQKKAEEELKESEKKFRVLFEQAADSVVLVDAETQALVDFNDIACKNLGYTHEEFRKLKVQDLEVLESPIEVNEHAKEVKTKGKEVFETRLQAKNGEIHDFLMKIRKVSVGGKDYFLGIWSDITERKKLEEKLMESEEKYRTQFEEAMDAIFVADAETGILLDCNNAALKLVGREKSDVVGKHQRILHPPKEIEGEFSRTYKQHLKEKEGQVLEAQVITEKGEIKDVAIKANVFELRGKRMIQGIFRDITERKKAEEELEQSEQRLRNIIDTSPDGIAWIDTTGKITVVNRKLSETIGTSAKDLIGKDFMDVEALTAESKKKISENFVKRLEGVDTSPYEVEFVSKTGEVIPVEISASLIHEGPKVVGIQSILRDLKERKKVEKTLRESEEMWRSLVELAPDGIITVNRKGMVTSANNAFTRLTGYSQDEIVGIHFTKLGTLRARDMPKYLKLMTSVLRGKLPPPFEYSYVRKNGTIGWGEAHVGLIKKDGKITGFQVLLREATRRKMAERATQESQERFQRLFMNNPEAAVYTDSKFHLLDVNPRFKELFGYSLDEIKGKHVDDIVVPKDKIKEAEMLNKKAKKGYVYHDTVRKKKDGSLVPVSISVAPITLEKQLVGYVALYKDISQLKETLEKLETMNEKLRVVGNLTRHDARNKLSTVTMNTFLAKQKLTENHEALQHLSEVESAVEQVERIFDFARIYEKLGMEELIYMDVEKSLEESASLFSDLKDIKVVNDCRGLTVRADSLLRQLFYNLIDNSLKHGKKVSQIRAYYEAGKDQLKLVYEDDGVGIPKAEKDKNFEEGYGKGTGYGLYLIKKMCEVYGWTIRETGNPGKGAQFTITIPKMNESGRMNYQLH